MPGNRFARQDVSVLAPPDEWSTHCLRTAGRPADGATHPSPLSPGAALDFYEPSARESEEDLKELWLRLMAGLGFLFAVTAVGTIGFKIIDPSGDWVRAFFMTAITLTTVGYGEVVPLETDGARIFAAILIFAGMGAVLYFVSTGTAFILEGQLGHVFRRRRMEKDLAALDRHLLVCGSGQTAIYTAQELVSVKRPVVMIADRPERVGVIRSVLPGVPILVGDPSEDETLLAAGF